MSGSLDSPYPHPEPTVQPDPFAGARSDVWSPPANYPRPGDSNPGWLASLTRPEAIAGETLVGGGALGRLLLNGVFGQRLALAAVGVGLILTAYSLAEHNKPR